MRRRSLRRGIAVAAGIVLIPFVFALLGDLWWFFELWAHFHGCYAIAYTPWALGLYLARVKRMAIVTGITVLLDMMFVVPLWIGPTTSGQPANLRVMSINVNTSNRWYRIMHQAVAKEQPDILVVQETDNDWITSLAGIRREYPYYVERPRGDNFGIAFYSKYPCSSLEVEDIGPLAIPSILARLEGFGELRIVSTHPMPPTPYRKPFARNEQLAKIAERIRRLDGEVLLIGDLNTSSWTRSFRKLVDRSELRDARLGFGRCPTWPGRFAPLGTAIDHALVSEGIEVVDYRVGDFIGSDHRAIIVDLRVESE
ncbi:MAG: endonuclease/exonuclease/phosphatase family protein [Planctomycetes bacterium]|nr:endonuclease/exonuclease/phosphatase family protein [Planctomycetota bacterium]